MSDLTEQQYFVLPTRVTETARIPLRLPAIIAGLLLSIIPFLTGCGVEGENGGQPITTVPPASGASATASLAWSPVTDSSVSAYFVHYGRQSPGQEGSCTYESSIIVDSSLATVTNLDPNTLYYFSVSAYNGLESACSNEVSLLTAPPSVNDAVTEEARRTLFLAGSL